ncbi:MAG: 4-alpha-glucanotransferase [Bacteroidota bacterium]
MKITFRINYHANWGQQVAIVGSIPELGNDDPKNAVRLQFLRDGDWQLILRLDGKAANFTYKYLLIDDKGAVLDSDWGAARKADFSKHPPTQVIFKDSWRTKYHNENAFYTSAFQGAIFKADAFKSKQLKAAKGKTICRFQLHAPRVLPGQQVCICGSSSELGDWDLDKPLLLGNEGHPLWTVDVALKPSSTVKYKYGLYDTATKEVLLESGDNRELTIYDFPSDNELLILSDEYFRYPQGDWKGAGVAIPVFSLRSKKGLGVGEFSDLPLLINWAKSIGFKMVQILPINDTSAKGNWIDSYPYAAISTTALHPLYLHLDSIDGFDEMVDQEVFQQERERLNALEQIDYEAVMALKLKYARAIYDKKRTTFLKSAAFKNFLAENENWLKPYAWFCHLRDTHGTSDFNQWGEQATFTVAGLKKACGARSKQYKDIAFYYFLQYYLDVQLKEAADYARANQVVLKGDIPIGIYRYSMDAWVAPELYNMNGQSGAPPDPFSDSGQNWGFPTYNWKEMAKDGYQWWQNRLQQLSRYFDAFRIDHILGFFRIWQIPVEQVEGIMGFFNPALPIRKEEFRQWSIYFDAERFCRPYITTKLLSEIFGDEADFVKQTYLQNGSTNSHLAFKEAFNTQRKIEAHFQQEENKAKEHLKVRLYRLISNVLFFEVPDSEGQAFHPRIDFFKTTSFRELDAPSRQRLKEMHDDYFYNRQEAFWKNQAMVKLPAISQATNMLICGEDLGMVPACVPGVMRDLGLLSLEIQRMSKNPATEFLQDKDIPYLSVCSPSTHDMSPIRAWWEEMDVGQRQRFYQQELFLAGEAPVACSPEAVKRTLWQHLDWPSMWAIFPIQDLVALDKELRLADPHAERINVPANPQHYWRYRFHINGEDLLTFEAFNDKLRDMLKVTGRV